MGIIARGSRLYVRYRGEDGRWRTERTDYSVGEESRAEAFFAELQAQIDARREARAGGGPITVATFSSQWIERRRARGLRSVDDDEARLRIHVLPTLGEMRLADVRPRHVRALIEDLRAVGKLAPRTVRHVYGVLHAMFRSAVAGELISTTPCVLERGDLPRKADADPSWRRDAIFTREELEGLISSDMVPADRRVLYALKGLAALRHSEAADLTWARVTLDAIPLGRIAVDETKSGVPRQVPIHPTLAALLREWKRDGWRRAHGRPPSSTDLVVPLHSRWGRLIRRGPARAQGALLADLEALSLRVGAGSQADGRRNRRGHDLRRTLISLALEDGARRDLLETITHGPRGDIISVYSTFQWSALCAELARVRVALRDHSSQPVTAVATTDNYRCNLERETGFELGSEGSPAREAAAVLDGDHVVGAAVKGGSSEVVVTSLVTSGADPLADVEAALVRGDSGEALRLVREIRLASRARNAAGFRAPQKK